MSKTEEQKKNGEAYCKPFERVLGAHLKLRPSAEATSEAFPHARFSLSNK